MQTRINPQVAWELIAHAAKRLPAITQKLGDAVGHFASCDINAPISLPPFDNSAVDGYALGASCSAGEPFTVVATIGAGETYRGALAANQACKIMTGAQIPTGAICVAMQEDVEGDASRISVKQATCEHENIRWAGEDVEAGTKVLSEGERISAAHVGLLAALGICEVSVGQRPSVAIVSTGSELVEPGEARGDGQVYYCTGPMLRAQCETHHARVMSVAKIIDDKAAIVAALHEAKAADIIIMIGGMAQGLYDHGRFAFEQIGVEPVFLSGQWRPGKPLFFGTLGKKLVFGLPGNPVAAFVMFKVFIAPAIEKMSGGSGAIKWRKTELIEALPKIGDKSLFLRGRHVGQGVELLAGQGSHQLFSLSQADSIVWAQPNGDLSYMAIAP